MTETFPLDILKKDYSILNLFCAAFGGEYDVEHYHKFGIRSAVLIDNDSEKLKEVARKFPEYSCVCMDAFLFIRKCNVDSFDLVISDHWSTQDVLIHGKYLEKLKQIARKYLILGINEQNRERHGINKEGLYKRSDFRGGQYWLVLKK